MEAFLVFLWQLNLELSLVITLTLLGRCLVRMLSATYECYALWLLIPGIFITVQLTSPILTFNGNEGAHWLVYNLQLPPVTLIDIPPPTLNHSRVFTLLCLVWLVSTALLILRLVCRHTQLRSRLSLCGPKTFHRKSPFPVVFVDDQRLSPCVYGFFRPVIYFPRHLHNRLDSTQIELIFNHEVQHINQGHLWLNLGFDLLICIFWFNPLLYWGRRRFRHDQELQCDNKVLRGKASEEAKIYGKALLTCTAQRQPQLQAACSWHTFEALEERILHLQHIHQHRLRTALIRTCCVISVSMMTGATAAATVGLAPSAPNIFAALSVNQELSNNEQTAEIHLIDSGKMLIQRAGNFYIYRDRIGEPLSLSQSDDFQLRSGTPSNYIDIALGDAIDEINHMLQRHSFDAAALEASKQDLQRIFKQLSQERHVLQQMEEQAMIKVNALKVHWQQLSTTTATPP